MNTEAAQMDWLSLSAARAERKRGTRGLLADLPRSRRTDPDTSHEAAEAVRRSGQLGQQQLLVVDAVKRFPGRTSAELGQLIAGERSEDAIMWRYRAARRLPEVAVGGHVQRRAPRVCGATGRPAVTWYASAR